MRQTMRMAAALMTSLLTLSFTVACAQTPPLQVFAEKTAYARTYGKGLTYVSILLSIASALLR